MTDTNQPRLPIAEFSVSAFRGLRDVRLEDCAQINLLVGDNNSGKTSLLEAIALVGSPYSIGHWRSIPQFRGSWPFLDRPLSRGRRLSTIAWLFPKAEAGFGEISLQVSGRHPLRRLQATCRDIHGVPPKLGEVGPRRVVEGFYSGDDSDVEERGFLVQMVLERDASSWTRQQELDFGPEELELVLWERGRASQMSTEGLMPTAFATPISHRSDAYLASRANRIIRNRAKELTLELLQQIDSRISDFVLASSDNPGDDSVTVPSPVYDIALHIEFEKSELVPIESLGDGVRRAFHLAALLSELNHGGVLLIDEVEVGMHTSVLSEVFRWLGQACLKLGIQLFATTHSLEAVDAIVASLPDDSLCLYRLEEKATKRYSGELLRTARFELGQEVR